MSSFIGPISYRLGHLNSIYLSVICRISSVIPSVICNLSPVILHLSSEKTSASARPSGSYSNLASWWREGVCEAGREEEGIVWMDGCVDTCSNKLNHILYRQKPWIKLYNSDKYCNLKSIWLSIILLWKLFDSERHFTHNRFQGYGDIKLGGVITGRAC